LLHQLTKGKASKSPSGILKVEHKQNVQKQAKIKKKKRSVTKICFAIEQKQQKTHKKYRKECSKSKRSDSNKTVNKIFGFHQFFAALSLFFFFF